MFACCTCWAVLEAMRLFFYVFHTFVNKTVVEKIYRQIYRKQKIIACLTQLHSFNWMGKIFFLVL